MIQTQVQAVLESTENLFNNLISLQAPQLCYFHDMTAFTPWDGGSNPFMSSCSLGLWGRTESPETTPLDRDGLKPL